MMTLDATQARFVAIVLASAPALELGTTLTPSQSRWISDVVPDLAWGGQWTFVGHQERLIRRCLLAFGPRFDGLRSLMAEAGSPAC